MYNYATHCDDPLPITHLTGYDTLKARLVRDALEAERTPPTSVHGSVDTASTTGGGEIELYYCNSELSSQTALHNGFVNNATRIAWVIAYSL